jgi:competence protein ComEC
MTTYSPNKLFFISGVSFLLGLIGAFFYCGYFAVNYLWWCLGVIMVVAVVYLLVRKSIWSIALLCFCLGAVRWLLIQPQLKPVNLNNLTNLEVVVLSTENKNGQYQQLIAKPLNKTVSKYQAILIRTECYPVYEKGNRLLVKGEIELLKKSFYSHNSWINFELNWPEIQLVPQNGFSFWLSINKIKKYLTAKINFVLKEPQAGFLRSLLFGRRSNLSQEIEEVLDKAGLSHLVAVSGLHLSLVSAILLNLFSILPLSRQLKSGGVLGCLLCFAALADFTPSVMRSLIMIAIMFLAVGLFRIYSSLTSWLVAALIMVFINPLVLFFDLGFQLSFLAALGIILFYPLLKQQNFWQSEIFTGAAGILRDTLLISLSSLILVSPWLIFKTTKVTTIALLSNILVVPIISWVLMLGLATIAAAIILPPLAWLGGFMLNILLSYIITISQLLISLPGAQLYISPQLTGLFLLTYPVVFWLYYKYRKQI